MQRTELVVAFLLGAVVALGAALVVTTSHASLPSAYAQGVSGNNEMLMVATQDQTNQSNRIFVCDTKNMRLVVYSFVNSQLNLAAARQITYDMKLYDVPAAKGDTSVSTIQKAAQDADSSGSKKGH
jgi:hypothetical protein